jgi:ADP-heptose:LPS heptosyltransferase
MDMTAAEATPTLTAPPAGAAALRNRIGFHFGASMPLRRMPLAEACDLLLRVIAETQPDADLYLVDAPDTRELNGAVLARLAVAPGRRLRRWEGDLAALKALLAQTHRFYAVDSGPAHLAAALGAETFVFFGPTLPVESRPLGPRVHVIERTDLGCRPCDRIHCTNPRYQECLTQVVRLLEPAGRLPAGGGDAVPLRAAPPAP